MKLDILLTIIIGFVTLFSIYRQWTRLEDKVRSQGERIVKLEQASRMRLPYKSYEELLDLMAAVEVIEQDLRFKASRLVRALDTPEASPPLVRSCLSQGQAGPARENPNPFRFWEGSRNGWRHGMLGELRNIFHDIRTGALPRNEIVPFGVWLLGRSFWFWFALIVIGAVIILRGG